MPSMVTLKAFIARSPRAGKSRSGFSLLEVAFAIGVAASAFVGVFGLLPVGLNTYHSAINVSVGTQIAQRVISELQHTDFGTLTQNATGVANDTFRYQTTLSNNRPTTVRYFDLQGTEVVPASPDALAASEQQKIVYWVNTRVMPVTTPPSSAGSAANANLATVTIQVASNPGNMALALSSAASSDASAPQRNLWTGALQSNPGNTAAVAMGTYFTLVSRNQ